MLKREITYETFDGEVLTEIFYFNISKPELVDLEVEYKEGLSNLLQKIVKAEDGKALVEHFKRIILLAYGEKSEDGKRFIKNDKLREEFSQSAAYNALFMELATDENAAATFIKGVIPKDMTQELDTKTVELPKDAPETPTPPPAA
jgi:hypothetical protein